MLAPEDAMIKFVLAMVKFTEMTVMAMAISELTVYFNGIKDILF